MAIIHQINNALIIDSTYIGKINEDFDNQF